MAAAMKSFSLSGYRFWSMFIFLLVLLSTACSSTKKLTLSEGSFPKVSVIDSLCLDQFQSGQFPGMAIAIAHQGKSWSRGYGYADAEKQIPVDPGHHLFRIGSISKSVTASALGRMVEKRQIDLDAPLSTYLKDCQPDKTKLTLSQLGGHMAFIRNYKG
jgi:CubicO group peptidase (beta-lactamase class C family)